MFFFEIKAEKSGGRLASEVVGSTIAKLGLHWCCQIHLDRSLRRDAKLRLVTGWYMWNRNGNKTSKGR